MILLAKRVFIVGYYGFGNTGDEVILQTMVAHLREYRPNLRIVVTSATPDETSAALGIEAVLWCSIAAIEKAVATSDLVLIGGGGLFFDTFGFDPAAFLTDHHTGIGFYAAPAVLGALYRKPVMLYAVGVGPLSSTAGRELTRLVCDLADVVTVRDAASKRILEALGVRADKVTLTADPAFGFVPDSKTCGIAARRRHPVIAVAVRPWDAGNPPDAWEREVAAALDAFVDRSGSSVLFVPFQFLPGRPEDDVAVARRFLARLRPEAHAEVLSDALDVPKTFTALAHSDLIVGVRLHSIVLGLLARVPVVAIDYDPKVGHLMRRLELDAQLLSLDTLRADALVRAMEIALASQEAAHRRLDGEVTRLTNLARQNAAHAVALLERPEGPAHRWSAEALELLPAAWREKARASSRGADAH